MFKEGIQMKSKLVLGFVFLLIFGFSSFSCFAQSSNNDQRIVGTWVYTSGGFNRTLVFNANGSGTHNDTEGKEGNFTYGVSVTGSLIARGNYPWSGLQSLYFSPDGGTLFFDGNIYRKR